MTKLCPRGKAAAKRKFKVYPSAYANAYASRICAGKIKDPSGVKRKDFKGRKPASMGGPMDNKRDVRKVEQMTGGAASSKREMGREKSTTPAPRFVKGTKSYQGGSTNFIKKIPFSENYKESIQKLKEKNTGFRITKLTNDDLFRMRRRTRRGRPEAGKAPPIQKTEPPKGSKTTPSRSSRMGGGLMEATQRLKRQGLRGGGICTKGMNRQAVGKNS